ncbi:MAG: class I SAM-dependent methyltransferase [Luteolibacter sp.]
MRKLTPEILDSLPHDDPRARSSRRDLRRINFVMGNDSWVLGKIPPETSRITELGAGDGHLLSRIAKKFPQTPVTAFDLAPRSKKLPQRVQWMRGDILTIPPKNRTGTLIANLFLHHFTQPELNTMSKWIIDFDTLIFSEPLRSRFPLMATKIVSPIIHPVTRHDMRVSIEAGFTAGELCTALHLRENGFTVTETESWLGAIRVVATKS